MLGDAFQKPRISRPARMFPAAGGEVRGSLQRPLLPEVDPYSGLGRYGAKGRNATYNTMKQSSYEPDHSGVWLRKRRELRSSNRRLKLLQELDVKREVQIKKEIAALEQKKKHREEETRRSINARQVRLAETGGFNHRLTPSESVTVPLKSRAEREAGSLERHFAFVFVLPNRFVYRADNMSRSGTAT